MVKGQRGRPSVLLCAYVVATLSASAAARAQEAQASPETPDATTDDLPMDEAIVEVTAPMAAGSDLDPTAAATTVRLDDRARALETTDEVLEEVPETRLRRTGSLGAFTGLSLRGANLDQTVVLLDDVPLGPADGGAFDLSTVPVSLLGSIEVYRGGAPLWLGAGGIGGVVRLVPRRDPGTRTEVAVGGGSFGTATVRGATSVVAPRGGPSFTAAGGVRHTEGDYPVDHDNGTPLVPEDDFVRRRQNGRVDEASGLLHLRAPALGGETSAVVTAFGRTGGLTGSPAEEPVHPRRQLARLLGVLGQTWRGGEAGRDAHRIGVTLAQAYERSRTSDPYGELAQGGPLDADDRVRRTFARVAAERDTTPWLALAAVASFTHDEYAPDDGRGETPRSRRERLHAASEARVHGRAGARRAELRLSVGAEHARARLFGAAGGAPVQAREARTTLPTARLASALELAEGLTLSASASAAARLPSLLELFGDRVFLVGDPELEAERGRSVDLGLVARGSRGPLRGAAEVRFFGLFSRDLIRYVATSQYRVVPQNVDRARVLGVSAGTRGSLGRHLHLVSSVTYMRTEGSPYDRELPLRPRLTSVARPEVTVPLPGRGGELLGFVEVSHVSENFTDPTNTAVIGARTLLGAGLAYDTAGGHARLSFLARDLLDARPADVVGFPLPGRSFAVELTVHAGDDR